MSFFPEDLQVYSFDALEEDDGLAGLLEEGLNEYNDETFGDVEVETSAPVGRDFDFAGSTSRFLGGTQPLVPAESSWTSTAHPPARPSPWNTLDADPLLSATPLQSSFSQHQPAQQQQQQQPRRGARTLEEIEAELRAQANAHQQSPQQRAGRPLTLEEVEAEMLRNARSPQPVLQQQQQHQQQQYAPSPQLQSAYPPQHQQHSLPQQTNGSFGQPPFGFPPGMPGMPGPGQAFSQQQFQQQQQQHFLQQQHLQRQQQQQHQQPFQQSPFQQGRPGVFPPGMLPPPNLPSPSLHPTQQPLSNLPPNVPTAAPGNMMGTLFPPLPSQGSVASVEQSLQYLSMNQHTQHPSLVGAQLQALLQQAQIQAQKEAGTDSVEQTEGQKQAAAGEELIRNVETRIREHEAMEAKRKSKAAKIASMAKHNNLMSNSDKDFITRIQVSQLVTDDPYADDFYFHIMAAIKMSRSVNANGGGAGPMMQGGGGGGGGGGGRRGERKPTRRENAMNKMAQNVQRLVDVAKQRNKSGQLSLDGTLGKIALRTRSAPRQLLQVSSTPPPPSASVPSAGHALLAGLISSSSDHRHNVMAGAGADVDEHGHRAPLSHRAVLTIVEEIYDAVLDLEQLRRIQPALLANAGAAKARQEAMPEDPSADEHVEATAKALEEWDSKYAELADKLWTTLRVMEPLDISVPHPFISLVSVLKGKRILPRALRHLSPEQTLTLLTLMVATFDTLDTVRDAPVLDATDDVNKLSTGSLEGKQRRAAVELKTDVFLNAMISPVMAVIGRAPLRMVTGMVGLLIERNDIMKVVKSKPGVAFLTVFLSHAESLKQATPPPEAQDLVQWQHTYTQLFHALSADLPSLFPSTRAVSALPFGPEYYLSGQSTASINAVRPDIDLDDEPVWRFLAAVAVCADPQQQQSLVMAVREKVLENVTSAKKGRVTPEVASLKIRNVDLLLHSIGLDSSQLTAEE